MDQPSNQTGSNTPDMHKRPALLIICCLALGPGGLFWAAGAHAIPDAAEPAVGDPVPAADLPVATQVSGQAAVDTGDEISDDVPIPDDLFTAAEPGDPVPSAAIPCMRGFTGQHAADSSATNDTCTDHTEGLQQPLSLQVGRRIGVNSGILDNYDGIRVDYRLSNGLKLNAVAGYPDISNQGSFNSAKRVLGFSADSARFARAWDMNSFYIEKQDKAGAISRAIGGALRYLRPRRSMLVFVDYDVAEHTLGALTATGAWKLQAGTTFSTTFDVRNSPVKKRQQKYLQKTMAATEGWNWALPSDRIRHFTSDRSEEVTTLAFGLSHTFSDRFKLTGSAAVLDVSTDPAANNAGTAPEQPSEYFYNLKLTGKDLVLTGDSNMIDLRHSITESSRISSASIDTRYAINRGWNISPRLRTDYRNNWLERSARWVTSPAVKMEYRNKKQYGFQIEAGGEWSTEQVSSQDKSRSSYFLSLGYQAKF